MYRDYSAKGVKFYYIYKALAHPETNGYVRPFTQEERLMHVKEAERRLGSEIPWLCDTIDNEVKHALGNAPNSEFIIDPEGRVVRKRTWSDPNQVRKDLAELVGPVEPTTTIADLNMKTIPPPKAAATGVVPHIERPRGMQPLKIEPVTAESKQPFYAKLRVEADADLLRRGSGKLYLRFQMDPLYNVHWNNLTRPIHVELTAPESATVEPSILNGPKVEVEADIDPREFLVEVERGVSRDPLRLTATYFACNDEAGWCKAIKQEYVVHFQQDRDGGWTQASRRGNQPQNRRPNAGPQNRFQMARGEVTAIDTDERTITVRLPNGREQTFAYDAGLQIQLNFRRSRPAELRTGDEVRMQFEEGSNDEPGKIRRMMAIGQ